MVFFVHAADLHLDSPLHGLLQTDSYLNRDELRGATRKALDSLTELCINKRVPLLLIAGDLYDGDWQDFSTGLYFVQQMTKLAGAGTRVAIIRGNHDAANKMTKSLVLPENVKVFSSKTPETWILDDLKVAIHGQSYPQAAVTENTALSYPEPVAECFNIGLHHCLLSGASGHQPYAPCTVEDLVAKGYDYWALGHVHSYQVLHNHPHIVYSGCTQGRHIKENGAKGCVIVRGERDSLETSFYPLDTIRWQELSVDVTDCSSPEQCFQKIREQLLATASELSNTLCMRVTLTGTTSAHNSLLQDRNAVLANTQAIAYDIFADRCLIQKINLFTSPKIDITTLSEDDSPLGELVRCISGLQVDDALSVLELDLTPLIAKLSGTGIGYEIDQHTLDDVRDILLHELASLERNS